MNQTKEVSPPAVGQWSWQQSHGTEFTDGDQYLVAVPVKDRFGKKWHYEYSIVTIRCDSGFFGLTCNDEPWGWDWDDVSFYIPLKEYVQEQAPETCNDCKGPFDEKIDTFSHTEPSLSLCRACYNKRGNTVR